MDHIIIENKDVKKLLNIIYNDYVNNDNSITPEYLLKKLDWGGEKITLILKYLKEKEAIKITFIKEFISGVQVFLFGRITSKGIYMSRQTIH